MILPPTGRSQNADRWPALRTAHRPFMAWGALVLFTCFGLLHAFLAVVLYAAFIRDDQVHGSGVPGGLWVALAISAASAVLDIILGVFIFRGARWAWLTAAVLTVVTIVAGVAVIATSQGGIGLTSLAPDIAVLGTLLNRNVREWCSRPGQAEREWYSDPRGGISAPWQDQPPWRPSDPRAVQLIACGAVTRAGGGAITTCTYGNTLTGVEAAPMYYGRWNITVYAARTGRVVGHARFVGDQQDCGNVAFAANGQVPPAYTDPGVQQLRAALARYVG
jgi:hypothetical protein